MSKHYNDIRGSIWRKWDLHFHTPSSFDYLNKSISNQNIINNLIANNISVVAITDHHIIDTSRVKELQDIGNAVNITVLPGIELRSELGGSESVHFIGIFPENCKIDDVWLDLQSQCKIKPTDVAKKGNDKILADLEDTSRLIRSLGGIVSVHAGSKTNSIENITNTLSYKMAQKAVLVDSIDIFELGQVEDQITYKEIVFPSIKRHVPLIICSDNHNVNDYKLKSNLWIKSDTTFEGLKQIIYEPKERVFIGETPELLERVHANKTKFLENIEVTCEDNYDGKKGTWFYDVTIPVNYGMVSIIGNKGSGKSALTDIIGLCGNSHHYNDFSFLDGKRFLKNGLAKNFKASLTWAMGKKL